MRILVVEPDAYYHAPFAETIGSLGELLISRGAEEAGRLFTANPPDAVITELKLPDRSGYDFLEDIQSRARSAFLPIIIFTQVDNLDDVKQALNFGITGYFVKGRDTIRDIRELLLNLNPHQIL